MALSMEGFILVIILGTMAGIAYSLRILVLVERRIARIDSNIQELTKRIFKEELRIESEEKKIEKNLKRKSNKK